MIQLLLWTLGLPRPGPSQHIPSPVTLGLPRTDDIITRGIIASLWFFYRTCAKYGFPWFFLILNLIGNIIMTYKYLNSLSLILIPHKGQLKQSWTYRHPSLHRRNAFWYCWKSVIDFWGTKGFWWPYLHSIHRSIYTRIWPVIPNSCLFILITFQKAVPFYSQMQKSFSLQNNKRWMSVMDNILSKFH